ncbi:methyl-accepting chemotaxis protein [Salsuginibacillus halophilus]|uniref:methyl-accepting chemotaxis protein n=1 Tax=Salsuginibacillus halophilus TaxID=517424 RepID=UPI000D0CBC20|nr:methyl-accepting chemotaxis protein [Salsuginibacillus halophilus]
MAINEIAKRNKLVVKLLWAAFIFGLFSNVIADVSLQGIIAYTLTGAAAVSAVTWLVWRGVMIQLIPYVLVISYTVVAVVMAATSPKLSNYLMVYVLLVFMTLYHMYRPIIGGGIAGLFMTNWFFLQYQETMFLGAGMDVLISLNVFMIIICAVLITQAKIGQDMQHTVEEKQKEATLKQEELQHVFGEVSVNASEVQQFSEEMNSFLNAMHEASDDVSSSFQTVADGAEEQSETISSMNNDVDLLGERIQEASNRADALEQTAGQNRSSLDAGQREIEELNESVLSLEDMFKQIENKMNALRDSAALIEGVVNSIENVSEQTNLLALNASVEAARAGEHGKGFSVVADEVRKLASDTQASVLQVQSILEGIENETQAAEHRVHVGGDILQKSMSAYQQVTLRLTEIMTNTKEMQQYAGCVTEAMKQAEKGKEQVRRGMTETVDVTETTSAAAEEAFARVEQQNNYLNQLNQQFSDLNAKNEHLALLVGVNHKHEEETPAKQKEINASNEESEIRKPA